MKCVAVIPARFGSQRLPGKPLLKIGAKPIIQHVYERTSSVRGLDLVLVATDDARIYDCVRQFGGQACMTSSAHRSGSDRIAEAVENIPCDWVLNVQGDEPFIDPSTLQALLDEATYRGTTPVYTVSAPIRSYEEWVDPAVVKVVTDAFGVALYFSRWPLPYVRNVLGNNPLESILANAGALPSAFPYRRHIGVYLYRRELLQRFVQWAPGVLETAELLEQLRILENGHSITVVRVPHATPGVDTAEDYERACRHFEGVGAPPAVA